MTLNPRRLAEIVVLVLLLVCAASVYGIVQRLIAIQVRVAVLEGSLQQLQLQYLSLATINAQHFREIDRLIAPTAFGPTPPAKAAPVDPWVINRFATLTRRVDVLESWRLSGGK